MPLPVLALATLTAESARTAPAGPDLGRYLVLSAVLILAIGGLALGFKKLVAKSVRMRASARSLQVLDVLPLGGKQRLCVVRVYDRTFALGVGDHGVATIAELDPVIGEERVARAPDFEKALEQVAAGGVLAPAARSAPPRVLRRDGVLA